MAGSATLPKYIRQVVKQERAVDIAPNQRLNPEGFASPVNNSVGQAGMKLEGQAKDYADYVTRQKQRDDNDLVIDMVNTINKDIDKLLYSQDIDDQNEEKGLMYKRGIKARGITEKAGIEFENIINTNLGTVNDDNIKEKIKQKIFPRHQTILKSLAVHEIAEKNKFSDEMFQAVFETNLKTAASVHDNQSLQQLMDNVDTDTVNNLTNRGASKEIIEAVKMQNRQEIVKSSLATLIEAGNIVDARDILSGNKKNVSAGFFEKMNTIIKGKELDEIENETWNNLQHIRTSEGYVDINNAYKVVQNHKDMTEKEKDVVYKNLLNRVSADKQRILQQRADNDRDFFNEVIKIHKDSHSYKDAIKLAAEYGYDDTDIDLKNKYVNGLFGINEQMKDNDGFALLDLYEKKFSGSLTMADINNAYANGLIDDTKWIQFRKDFADKAVNLISGSYAQGQALKNAINEYASSQAENKFDQTEIKNFFYEQLYGKNFDDAKNIFNDLIKKEGLFFMRVPAYRKQMNQREDYSKFVYSFNDIFKTDDGNRILNTRQFVDAIKKGCELTKKELTSDAVNDVIQYCGSDNLKNKESAQFKAVQWLVDHNKPVVIPNIEALIKSQN